MYVYKRVYGHAPALEPAAPTVFKVWLRAWLEMMNCEWTKKLRTWSVLSSGTNRTLTRGNIPEERRSQMQRCEILKT